MQAADVNLQRGFVPCKPAGACRCGHGRAAAALQPTEWQSIPRALQQNLQAASANFAYRLVEPAFQLPLKLDRHEAAKLLPARVNNITFTSVISDDGVMLTQVRLEMSPGRQTPAACHAAQGRAILVRLRESERRLAVARGGRDSDSAGAAVAQWQGPCRWKSFTAARSASAGARALDLELLAPKFDLPLENIPGAFI